MLLPLLLWTASPFALAGRAVPDVSKGAALVQGCEAELRLMQRNEVAAAPQTDLVNGTYCIGYVNGFLANIPTQHASTICPGDRPMAALIAAYVHYMQDNPQLLREDKRLGLRLALQSAFPCSASGEPALSGVSSRRDRL